LAGDDKEGGSDDGSPVDPLSGRDDGAPKGHPDLLLALTVSWLAIVTLHDTTDEADEETSPRCCGCSVRCEDDEWQDSKTTDDDDEGLSEAGADMLSPYS
jgi:hypothetical protein